MKAAFADAGYWIALLNPRDRLHDKALRLSLEFDPDEIVTSQAVLAEVLNHFAESGPWLRGAAWSLIERLCDNRRCRVIPQTSGQFRDAARLYGQRPDKQWSLTDCSSMLIMRAQDIRDALACDKHFEQAGFTALLRPDE